MGRPADCRRCGLDHALLMPAFESDFDRLVVPVPPRVRHELALWLRRERLLVFADLHDHPHRAFLSEADVVATSAQRTVSTQW